MSKKVPSAAPKPGHVTPGLNPRQARFVLEYLKDLNATQAAVRAGYSKRTARVTGSENLTKPAIQQAIADGQAKHIKKAEMDVDEWRAIVAKLARSDLRQLFDPATGKLIPINDLPDEAAACLASVEVLREKNRHTRQGEMINESVIKVRLWSKEKALELVGKHLGILTDKLEVAAGADLLDRLMSARKRTRAV